MMSDYDTSFTSVVGKGVEPAGTCVWSPFGFLPACYGAAIGDIQPDLTCGECDDVYESTELLMEHYALDHLNFAPYRCTFRGCEVGRYSQRRLAQHIKARRHGSPNTFLYKDDPEKRALLLEMVGVRSDVTASFKPTNHRQRFFHVPLHNNVTTSSEASSPPAVAYSRLQQEDNQLRQYGLQHPHDLYSNQTDDVMTSSFPVIATRHASSNQRAVVSTSEGGSQTTATRAPPRGRRSEESVSSSDLELFPRRLSTPLASKRARREPKCEPSEW